MKKLKTSLVIPFVLLLISLFNGITVFAQTIELNTSNVQLDAAISGSDAEIIYENIEKHLAQYAEFGTLFDQDENKVTQKSHDRFLKLFTNTTAMIVQDYEYAPILRQRADEYALIVYNNLRQRGLEFKVEEAIVIDMGPVGSGTYYKATIEVTKRRYNYLKSDGSEQKFPGGELIKEKFLYDIRNDDLSNPSIGEIKLNSVQKLADVNNQIISLSVGVGSSTQSYSEPNLKKYGDSGELSSVAGLNYSFGIDFQTDKWINKKSNPNKAFGLSLGLRFSSYSLNSELSNYSLDPFTQVLSHNGDSQTYDRWVGPVSVQEDLRVGVLEIPLGISYELSAKQKSAFFITFRVVPTLGLSSSGTLTGDGYYEAQLWDEDDQTAGVGKADFFVGNIIHGGSSDPSELETNGALDPYQTGLRNIESDVSPTLKPFSLALQLSPAVYLNFSDGDPSWGVMLALDLGYRFNSLIELNPASSRSDMPFRYSDTYNSQGLSSNFVSSASMFSYGLRIGIFRRLISSPS